MLNHLPNGLCITIFILLEQFQVHFTKLSFSLITKLLCFSYKFFCNRWKKIFYFTWIFTTFFKNTFCFNFVWTFLLKISFTNIINFKECQIGIVTFLVHLQHLSCIFTIHISTRGHNIWSSFNISIRSRFLHFENEYR